MMQLLPKERLAIAIGAVAATERAVAITTDYVKERRAFGSRCSSSRTRPYTLAERKTEALIARVFIDWCVERVIRGELDAVTASMAKYWTTDKQCETADECLQLHGGLRLHAGLPRSPGASWTLACSASTAARTRS
jgi:acyl-CoA dehydrogenase